MTSDDTVASHRGAVFLHGHGDEPSVRVAESLVPRSTNVRVPRGPHTLADGSPAWFASEDPPDAPTLVAAVRRAIGPAAGSPDSTVLVGYSQGGATGIGYALHGDATELVGVVAIASWLPDLGGADWSFDPTVPVLVVHGADDDVVDPLLGRSLARLLARNDVPVTWCELAGVGHALHPSTAKLVRSWVRAVEHGERPDEPPR